MSDITPTCERSSDDDHPRAEYTFARHTEYRAGADDGELPYSNEDTSPEYGPWGDVSQAGDVASEFAKARPAYERIWIERRTVAFSRPEVHVRVRSAGARDA